MSLRDEYQQEVKARFQEQKAKLDLLRARAKRVAARGRILAYEEVAHADKTLAEARAKLKPYTDAGSGAMSELKTGITRAYSDLKSASQKAVERLRANPPEPPPKPKPAPSRTTKPRPAPTRRPARATSAVRSKTR
jgi:hypothetical protein